MWDLCGYLLVIIVTVLCMQLKGCEALSLRSPNGTELEGRVPGSEQPEPPQRVGK